MRFAKVWLVDTAPIRCGGKFEDAFEDEAAAVLLVFVTEFGLLPFVLLLDGGGMPSVDNAVTGACIHVSISDDLHLVIRHTLGLSLSVMKWELLLSFESYMALCIVSSGEMAPVARGIGGTSYSWVSTHATQRRHSCQCHISLKSRKLMYLLKLTGSSLRRAL